MKVLITAAAAGLLLATGGAAAQAQPPAQARPPAPADAPCAGQIHPNPGFERGATGWTVGPRMIVLGDQARPAHHGRAYAAFAGLDLSHSDLLRTTVPVPAGCNLTVQFWVRTITTEATRGDYLNVGMAGTGEPPKTRFSLAFDGGAQWRQYSMAAGPSATERSVIVSFLASESAGGGVTGFDVDDVTFTLS